jgi:leucyl aminopeptidase
MLSRLFNPNFLQRYLFAPSDLVLFIYPLGLTVEIDNTDAEGRLVLADGLTYVQKNYKYAAIG